MKRSLLLMSLCVLLLCISLQPAPQVQADMPACSANLVTTAILADASYEQYVQMLKSLAGEIPVTIGGQPGQAIYTRFAPAMASNSERAKAIPWLQEQLNGWLQPVQLELDEFNFSYNSMPYTSHNIIATIPGSLHPEEVVILSAHLDSISDNPFQLAPGAEDNASGSSALLEAARIFRYYRFERTVKFIWFNAEEQGLLGSAAYVADHPTDHIVGVVNLDMFGYDTNQDGCFELHVGSLPESQPIGECFANTIQSNGLPLTFDYLTDTATSSSDHGTFWDAGVGAVEVLENHFFNELPGGCVGVDANPFYHKQTDYTIHMDLPITFQIARAGLATAANLAGPLGVCYETPPSISFFGLLGANLLQFEAPQAEIYTLERSTGGCEGEFSLLGNTPQPEWLDSDVVPGVTYAYRLQVVADASRGHCLSAPVCQEFTAPEHFLFLPSLLR